MMTSTQAFEALKEKAIDLGFRITGEASSFGNADFEDPAPAADKE